MGIMRTRRRILWAGALAQPPPEAQPPPRQLEEADVASFMEAAEARRMSSPSIYELVTAAEMLSGRYPVEARAAIKYMKWLVKRSRTHLGMDWENPWD